jgi:hypothetical protein
MSPVYEAIGRAVVGYVRRRYGRELRVAAGAAGFAIVLAAVAAYLSTRDEED